MHIFDFFRDIFSVFGAFSRFLGVKFGFENPARVKEMTNMRYDPGLDKLCSHLATQISFFGACSAYRICLWQKLIYFNILGSLLLYLAHLFTVTLLTLTHSGFFLLFSAHFGSLSLALSGAYRLIRSFLGLLRCSCVAPVNLVDCPTHLIFTWFLSDPSPIIVFPCH